MVTFTPRGTFTALVTPLSEDASQIDWGAYERLIETQVQAGVSALVVCGTTGEGSTLSSAEKMELVRRGLGASGGRIPVVAGMGTSDTQASVVQARRLQEAGANALMVAMPAYSRPSQTGLEKHLVAIASGCDLPVVLYDVPRRTCVSLELETLERVAAACANVVALKDASGHVLNCQKIQRRLGDRIAVLCGDDPLTVPMMSVGSRGVISVTANVLPAAVVRVVDAALRGDFSAAMRAHLALLPVHEALFAEASPGPVKAAMAQLGYVNDSLRLPLTRVSAAAGKLVNEAVRAFQATRSVAPEAGGE